MSQKQSLSDSVDSNMMMTQSRYKELNNNNSSLSSKLMTIIFYIFLFLILLLLAGEIIELRNVQKMNVIILNRIDSKIDLYNNNIDIIINNVNSTIQALNDVMFTLQNSKFHKS